MKRGTVMSDADKMSLHDYYYDLPEELIAQDPLEDRSSSRVNGS